VAVREASPALDTRLAALLNNSVPPQFDLIYAPYVLAGYPSPAEVLARDVPAIDRLHALLWWLRTELGITLDPVTMFDHMGDGSTTHTLDCGCEVDVEIVMRELGRLERWDRGEATLPTFEVEAEPCPTHPDHDWSGIFAAWKHDPTRPDTFYIEDSG
jgi:hypothetical protein